MPSSLVTGGLVAEIKMRRTQHGGSFLVVEGNDDMRFWKPHSHNSCRRINGGGKNNAVRGLLRLDQLRYEGILGVVDSNLDHLLGKSLQSANLVATDAHDLECLLCRSSALDHVLAELGDDDKIDRFNQRHSTDVRTALLERSLVLGRLRWAARRMEPNIGVLHINPTRFVDESTWTVNDQALIDETAHRADVDAQLLHHQIAQLPTADPWYVVHGHDLVEILKIGLRRVLGNLRTTIGVEQIAGLLRQAIPPQDLQVTGLWHHIRRWESRNKPFLVLAD